VKLYDYWRSSSAWRVRIALNCKGIAYARQSVNLIAGGAGNARGGDQHQATFAAINPLAQVPVLQLDDAETGGRGVRHLAQSLAILEFLEERFPAPPLLPADPWLRARARQLAEMINAGTQPLLNMTTTQYVKNQLGGDPTAWVIHFLTRGLTALEQAATETAATFLVGDAVSFADVYLIPQLYAAHRFSVPLDAFPTLLRAEAACAALPAFAAAHPDRHPDRPASPGP
jgi:maleylpyruvate isomerase